MNRRVPCASSTCIGIGGALRQARDRGQTGKAQHHHDQHGAPPPWRQRRVSRVRRCCGHERDAHMLLAATRPRPFQPRKVGLPFIPLLRQGYAARGTNRDWPPTVRATNAAGAVHAVRAGVSQVACLRPAVQSFRHRKAMPEYGPYRLLLYGQIEAATNRATLRRNP